MEPHPGLAAIRPLLRWLVPFLLILAASEMLLTRVLVRGALFWLPGGRVSGPVARSLGDLGLFSYVFSALVAGFLLFLLGVMTRYLHAWPPPFLGWVGSALSAFAVWSLLRTVVPLPDARVYPLFSAALALAMLMTYFGDAETLATRAFAVLLGAAVACMFLADGASLPPAWGTAARRAGELLGLGCGALCPAVLREQDRNGEPHHAFTLAVLAAVPAGLFLLLYGRGPVPPHPRWSTGWMSGLPLPGELPSLVHAGVLFIFLLALFRGLAETRWRLQAYGLAFLFLAGIRWEVPYQHLLGLTGLVLLTRGAMPGPRSTAAPA